MKANLRRSVETNRTRSNSRAVPHCQLVPHRGWPRVRRKSRCTISQLAYTPKKQFHVQQPTASYFKAYKLKRNCNFLMLLSKECFNLLALSPAHPREIPSPSNTVSKKSRRLATSNARSNQASQDWSWKVWAADLREGQSWQSWPPSSGAGFV